MLSRPQEKALARINGIGLRQLENALQSDRAVAFLGAGASAPMYPVWATLIARMMSMSKGELSPAEVRALQHVASPDFTIEIIRERIGRSAYLTRLSDLMTGTRDPETGNPWTRTHELAAALPFRGYVTTNFDNGLVEALSEATRKGQVRSTTWDQTSTLQRWVSDDIFYDDATPVLHAHGSLADPESIVLATSDFRRAYKTSLPLALQGLMERQHIVWIGFGFSDPYVNAIQSKIVQSSWKMSDAGNPAHRHIAILPWFVGARSVDPDILRRRVALEFASSLVLYPVIDGDHRALDELLASMVQGKSGDPKVLTGGGATTPVASSNLRVIPTVPILDLTFDRESRVLAGWCSDRRTKIVALYGPPAVGKSTFVAKFLDAYLSTGAELENRIFVWNFERGGSISQFKSSLLAWLERRPTFPVPSENGSEPRRSGTIVFLDDFDNLVSNFLSHRTSEGLHPDVENFLLSALTSDDDLTVVLTVRNPLTLSRFRESAAYRETEIVAPTAASMADAILRSSAGIDEETAGALVKHVGTMPGVIASWCRLVSAQSHWTLLDVLNSQRGETFSTGDPYGLDLLVAEFTEALSPEGKMVLASTLMLGDWATSKSVADVLASVAGSPSLLSEPKAVENLLRRELRPVVQSIDGTYRVVDTLRPSISRMLTVEGLLSACVDWLLTPGQGPGGLRLAGTDAFVPRVVRALSILLDEGHWDQAQDIYRDEVGQGHLIMDTQEWALGVQIELGFIGTGERMMTCRDRLGETTLNVHLMNLVSALEYLGDYRLAQEFLSTMHSQLTGPDTHSRVLWACAFSRVNLQLGNFYEARRGLSDLKQIVTFSDREDSKILYLACQAAIDFAEFDLETAREHLNAIGLVGAGSLATARRLSERRNYFWVSLLWAKLLIQDGQAELGGKVATICIESAESRRWESELTSALETSAWIEELGDTDSKLRECLERASRSNLNEVWAKVALHLAVSESYRDRVASDGSLESLGLCNQVIQLSRQKRLRLLEFHAHLRRYWLLTTGSPSVADASESFGLADQSLRASRIIAENEGFSTTLLELAQPGGPRPPVMPL